VAQPHIQLGLGQLLGGRSDIAERFDARWKATVNTDVVRGHWPVKRASASAGRTQR